MKSKLRESLPAPILAMIEEHKDLQVQQSKLWVHIAALRKQYEALSAKESRLKRKIGKAYWKTIKHGDQLTNGRKTVEVSLKIDATDNGYNNLSYIYLEPHADGRDRFYESWMHPLDGFATGNGWRKVSPEEEKSAQN